MTHHPRTIRALNDSSAARELLVTLTTLLGGEPVIEPPGGFPAWWGVHDTDGGDILGASVSLAEALSEAVEVARGWEAGQSQR